MAETKFQGYARGGQFKKQDPGYDGLQAMQNHTKRVLRNMEGNLRSLEQRNAQAERDLLEVHRNEQQNKQDIYLEDDIHKVKKEAIATNIGTLKGNMRANQVRHATKV